MATLKQSIANDVSRFSIYNKMKDQRLTSMT